MKIYSISDLHLSLTCNKPMNIFGPVWHDYWQKIVDDWQAKVTAEDVVLIAGDISWAMKFEDALKDIEQIAKLNGKKIFIRGNHDYWWKSLTVIRSNLPKDCFVLQNDSLQLGDFVFCGSRGWTVPEPNTNVSQDDQKMLNREFLRLELSLKSAAEKLAADKQLICMIHYPPFNSKFEDSIFTKLMEQYNVKKCVYGHLHGKSSRGQKVVVKNGVEYYLTSCDKVDNTLVQIV